MFSSYHFLKSVYWLVAVLCFTTLWGRVQAAPQGKYCQECNVSGVCKCNVQGYCIPNRRSYGFYHTTWRMWPEENRKKTGKRELSPEGLKGIRRTIIPDTMHEAGVAPPREKDPAETPSQTNQQDPAVQPEQQQDRQIYPFRDEPQQPSDEQNEQNEQNEDQSYLRTKPADRIIDYRPQNVLRQGPHATSAAGAPIDNRVSRDIYGNIQHESASVQSNLSAERSAREKELAEALPQTNQWDPAVQPDQQQVRLIDSFWVEPQQPSDEQNEDQPYLRTGSADHITDFRSPNVLWQGPHATGTTGPAASTPVEIRVPRKTYRSFEQASATVQLKGNTVSANPLRGRGSMSTVSTSRKSITDKLRTISNRGDTDWLPANNPLRAP